MNLVLPYFRAGRRSFPRIGILAAACLLLAGCLLGPAPHPDQRPASAERAEPAGRPVVSSTPAPSAAEPLVIAPLSPRPPALTLAEARRQLEQLLPPAMLPLSVNGQPLLHLVDLQDDEEPEGFALAVSAALPGQPVTADAGILAERGRLYAAGVSSLSFSLVVLANEHGHLRLSRSIALGEWRVFERMRLFPLITGQRAPLVVSVTFATREGEMEHLLAFSAAGGSPLCRITLRRTLDTHAEVRDIDGNGVLDLFIREEGLEEGIGYETLLSWNRWNGTCFVPYRTVNVVRNLTGFLDGVRGLLVAKNYAEVVRRALDPEGVKLRRAAGMDNRAIMAQALGLDEELLREGIREVIFPEILENPFTAADARGTRFPLTFRLITSGGGTCLAEASLLLPANPFGEHQFLFTFDH